MHHKRDAFYVAACPPTDAAKPSFRSRLMDDGIRQRIVFHAFSLVLIVAAVPVFTKVVG